MMAVPGFWLIRSVVRILEMAIITNELSLYDDQVDFSLVDKKMQDLLLITEQFSENNFPSADCFRCEECLAPNRLDVGNGQCIVRTLYLSVDPAQRCRMNKSTGVDYLAPYEIGELVDGLEGIGVVEMVSPE
ncbi:unnamed protein product [Onchocerca ochengi]|uniref:15-oxoprostaglandin 13-reductase n=1 Tax=Onchocerca ochengi TaxID=42157 RepID=A0A182ERX0_ONCOC|nr:unnamed protein product [Onchocerca ochengi]